MSGMVRGANGVKVEDYRGRTFSYFLFLLLCHPPRLVIRHYAFSFLVIKSRQRSVLLRIRRYRYPGRFLGLTVEWLTSYPS